MKARNKLIVKDGKDSIPSLSLPLCKKNGFEQAQKRSQPDTSNFPVIEAFTCDHSCSAISIFQIATTSTSHVSAHSGTVARPRDKLPSPIAVNPPRASTRRVRSTHANRGTRFARFCSDALATNDLTVVVAGTGRVGADPIWVIVRAPQVPAHLVAKEAVAVGCVATSRHGKRGTRVDGLDMRTAGLKDIRCVERGNGYLIHCVLSSAGQGLQTLKSRGLEEGWSGKGLWCAYLLMSRI